MKKLNISVLCALFLLTASCGNLFAQAADNGEKYYSNPKKGINPTVPKAYFDTTIVEKSDEITVELTGGVRDTTPKEKTAKSRNLPDTLVLTLNGNSPYYWGTGVLGTWDPWYGPCCGGWYWGGWYGRHWMISHSWGWDPWWSWSWGPSWWWHDPFYYDYYSWGYYPYYAWGGYYGYYGYGWHNPRRPYSDFGHRYVGGSRTNMAGAGRNNARNNIAGRGASRRGGVDINRGGRGSTHNVSGTPSITNRGGNSGSGRGTVTGGRYSRPASVASNRSEAAASRNTSRYSSNSGSSRSGYSSSRGTTTGRTFTNSSSSRTSSRTFDNGSRSSSSSRSTFSNSSRSSSSSSRSTFSSSSSSSRSSGGFSGSSSRGGGGHSSSSSHVGRR